MTLFVGEARAEGAHCTAPEYRGRIKPGRGCDSRCMAGFVGYARAGRVRSARVYGAKPETECAYEALEYRGEKLKPTSRYKSRISSAKLEINKARDGCGEGLRHLLPRNFSKFKLEMVQLLQSKCHQKCLP